MSRCLLGSQTALINKLLFGLEIVSKPKYEPLKNISALSKGTLHSVLHFCILLGLTAFMDEENEVFSFAQPSKSSKEELIPIQSSFIHTHFTSHIFPDPLLPISTLSRKKIFFWEICAYSKSSAAAFLRNIPRYWQQVSTGARHRVVPQSAAADRHHSLSSKP